MHHFVPSYSLNHQRHSQDKRTGKTIRQDQKSSIYLENSIGNRLSWGWLSKDLVVPNLCLPTEVIWYVVVSILSAAQLKRIPWPQQILSLIMLLRIDQHVRHRVRVRVWSALRFTPLFQRFSW